MGIKYTKHFHMAVGVNIVVEITPEPPFVIVKPEPIATSTKEPEGEYFSSHEHEMIELPSIEISFSSQTKIGNVFMSHSHYFNATGISIIPPGASTVNVGYTAPPLDILDSFKEEYIEEVKKDYINFFKKTIKVINNDIIINNEKIDYETYNFNNYINYYINNNLKKINAKFSNNK